MNFATYGTVSQSLVVFCLLTASILAQDRQQHAERSNQHSLRLPDKLSRSFLVHNKVLIHYYSPAVSAKPDVIVFHKDGKVTNQRAGLGTTWKLVDDRTLRVGKVKYVYDKRQGILVGRAGDKLHSYLFIDNPKEKVVTPDAAKAAVVNYFLKARGGIRAEEILKVTDNFHVGFEAQGFAGKGDRVWQVHLHSLHNLSGAQEVFWVNARTGEVRKIHPVQDK